MEDIVELPGTEIKRLFPDPYYFGVSNLDWCNKVEITREGVTSITPCKVARIISHQLFSAYQRLYGKSPQIIIDATANIGGNTLSFAREFPHVIAYEIKHATYNSLVHNTRFYKCRNIQCINDDFTIASNKLPNTDVIFIDPPWFINGQPNTRMMLDYRWRPHPQPLEALIVKIILQSDCLIAVKVPKRFTLRLIESSRLIFKKMDVLIFHR